MYCKKCGKSLPDDARFCDRCNMSVRKQSDKQDRIDELKEGRLARRQAKAVEERLKKIKKVKNKRVKTVIIVILLILLVGVLSGVVGWIMVNLGGDNIETGVTKPEATKAPTPTPEVIAIGTPLPMIDTEPTQTPEPTPAPASLNVDGYYVTKLSSMDFAYPISFRVDESGIGNMLSLYDSKGDAVLIVGKTVTGASADVLMKNYISAMAGVVMESVSGDSWYEASLKIGNEIYHRKSCVGDGFEIYYEINYPASSANRQQYIADIAYMDAFFTNE